MEQTGGERKWDENGKRKIFFFFFFTALWLRVQSIHPGGMN